MKYTHVFFDLDGTLLPMDQDLFVNTYFKLLCKKAAPLGYEPQKLVKGLWTGTEAMIRNDGSRLNHDVFWQSFDAFFGEEKSKDEWLFDEFYSNEFNQAKACCGFDPLAAETVRKLKALGKTVVLATNPIFPAVATENRLRWTGLEPEEFAYFTHYGNSCCSKPNPAYFQEILDNLGLRAENVLMVGNDAREDTAAMQVGIDVYLITHSLLNRDNMDLSRIPHGSFADLQTWLGL